MSLSVARRGEALTLVMIRERSAKAHGSWHAALDYDGQGDYALTIWRLTPTSW
jgi:hypothetical protein